MESTSSPRLFCLIVPGDPLESFLRFHEQDGDKEIGKIEFLYPNPYKPLTNRNFPEIIP